MILAWSMFILAPRVGSVPKNGPLLLKGDIALIQLRPSLPRSLAEITCFYLFYQRFKKNEDTRQIPLAWIAHILFWLLKYSERRCCQNKFWVNKSFTFCTFFAVLKVLWLEYEVLTCKLPLGQYCVKMHRFGGSTQAPMKTVKFSWDISLICKNVVESTRLKSTQTKN